MRNAKGANLLPFELIVSDVSQVACGGLLQSVSRVFLAHCSSPFEMLQCFHPRSSILQAAFLLQSQGSMHCGDILPGQLFGIQPESFCQCFYWLISFWAPFFRCTGATQMENVKATQQMPRRKLSFQGCQSGRHPFLRSRLTSWKTRGRIQRKLSEGDKTHAWNNPTSPRHHKEPLNGKRRRLRRENNIKTD